MSVLCAALCLLLPASLTYATNTGQFWHVTDFHYDHTYWTSQLSCNAEVAAPSQWGDYWCDSPWALVTAAIEAMRSHQPDVDFLLWTGDTVAHISDDNLTVDINVDVLQNITDALRNAFPTKKVYATFGNHDYYPSDQFPNFNNIIYNRTADMWRSWIEESQQMENFRKGGYYTRLVPNTPLRITALNTNLYYTSNKQMDGIDDPSDQLQWLGTVLQSARSNNEKVLVTAHIPPGVHTPSRVVWFQSQFVEPINSVLREFSDIIVGMHFGHDHSDGFKVYYDNQGRPAAPLFVAPSVTPWRYRLPTGETGPPHNPSVRLVTFDRTTGKTLDIEQFHLDLPAVSSQPTANFTRLYSFTERYSVPDLSAASLDKLMTRMETSAEGDTLLEDYFRFSVAGADQGSRTCDRTCKNRLLCGFKHHTYEALDDCVEKLTSSASALSAAWAAHLLAMRVLGPGLIG